MKHLILAVAIALLSTSAATTAWSQETTPTEQETKDFIVETMGKCEYVNEVKFEGSNLHLSTFAEGYMANPKTGKVLPFKQSFNGIVPVQKLKEVYAYQPSSANFHVKPNAELKFRCRATEDACLDRKNRRDSESIINACTHETNEVVAKAFNHLIGIYKAENPPLFE